MGLRNLIKREGHWRLNRSFVPTGFGSKTPCGYMETSSKVKKKKPCLKLMSSMCLFCASFLSYCTGSLDKTVNTRVRNEHLATSWVSLLEFFCLLLIWSWQIKKTPHRSIFLPISVWNTTHIKQNNPEIPSFFFLLPRPACLFTRTGARCHNWPLKEKKKKKCLKVLCNIFKYIKVT